MNEEKKSPKEVKEAVAETGIVYHVSPADPIKEKVTETDQKKIVYHISK